MFPSDKNKNYLESLTDQLIKEAEKGNSFLVTTFLSSNNYSIKSKDVAFRKCIKNFPIENQEKEEYYKCFRSFIDYTEDFNFRNENEDNQTILMEACTQGLTQVILLILKNSGLNINITDNTNENVLHKLIRSPKFKTEEEKLDLLNKFASMKIEINKENINGYTPFALAMIAGNSSLSQELLKLGANKNHIVHSTGDSILHCAVQGKNPLCVALLLNEINDEFKKVNNKNGETSVDLAAKMGLNKLIQLIGEVPNSNSTKVISMLKPFEDFLKCKYEESLESLNKIKISKESNPPINWNIILTQFMMLNKSSDNLSLLDKENIIVVIDKVRNFFENFESQQHFSLLSFNKAILNYKFGLYKKTLSILLEDNNFNKTVFNHKDWIIYLNMSIIFLEIFINLRQLKVSKCILDHMEDFLNLTQKNKQKETLKENICEYLNSVEILNNNTLIEDSLCVIYIFKSYKFILENKLEDSKKYLKEYKRISTCCKHKDQLPIFYTTKNIYHYLKIQIDYLQGSFFKCYKNLNRLNGISNSTLKNNSIYVIESQIFQMNAMGIINLRQKKFYLARCFFKNCLISLKKSHFCISNLFPEFLKYAVNIKYNLGLCHFFEKNYEKAYKLFSTISSHLDHYPYVFYRTGLCCLEIELASQKLESNNCYNEIVEKLIGYGEKISSNNLNVSPIINNYENIIQNDDNKDNSISYHLVNLNHVSNIKRVILRNVSSFLNLHGKIKNKHINEAISNFKQTILLLKDNVYLKKQIGEVLSFCNNIVLNETNFPTEVKSHMQLMTSSYLNLIFSLILLEDWNEVLFYADEFEKSVYFNREIGYLLDNYKIEAYLSLNKHSQILELLKKNMSSYSSLEFKGSFYSKINKMVYQEINYKMALYVNIIKMNFITNNLPEVEKGILSVLNLLNINLNQPNAISSLNELPQFIFNMLIYYYVIKENYDVALGIIKTRKIPLLFVQNIFQPAISKLTMNIK